MPKTATEEVHPILRYCDKRDMNLREFADLCGIASSYVSQLSTGFYPCGRETALKIFDATEGEIDIGELLLFE